MTSPTESIDRDPGAWAPCQNGELSSLSGRLRAAAARRRQRRVAGGTLAAVAALLVVTFWPSATPGALTCTECVDLMPAYEQQLVGGEAMAADQAEAVREHLDACPKCRQHFEKEFPAAEPPVEAIGLLTRLGLLARA